MGVRLPIFRVWLPLAFLTLWVATALAAPTLGLEPDRVDLSSILLAPGSEHPLGCDDLGRPVLDRLLAGARTSLLVGLGAVAAGGLLGTIVGACAGFFGGWVDLVVSRLADAVLAFPGILLAIALAGILGPGIDNVVLALIAAGWVGYARLTRAQVLSLVHRDHVTAARALGRGSLGILGKHLIPLALPPLIVEATFGVGGAVLAEAGLSFLGLGVQPPDPSWGSLVRDGVSYLLVAPHLALVPGAAIFLVVLSVNQLGDRLRDRLDVRAQALLRPDSV